MPILTLTKGYVAIVDADDFVELSQHKWTAVVTGKHVKRVYAYRRASWDNALRRWRETIWLHRAVLNAPAGFDVDHLSGDTLDNRRSNLRLADRSQNLANNRRALGKTGLRGVTATCSGEKLPFKAMCRGKYLGTFETAELAAAAYDERAAKEFGEFAKLNSPIVARMGVLQRSV